METENHTGKAIDPKIIIKLLDVYLTEWIHRDTILWSQIYRFFYAILIVIVSPYIASYLNITLPQPSIIFEILVPILGIILTFLFWYVSLGYAKRLEASGSTYQKLINTLPAKYQRVKLEDINGRIYKPSLAKFVIWILSVLLIIICIVMFLFSLIIE